MLPHKRGAKSKTLESTQTPTDVDKKRERERKREREKERKREREKETNPFCEENRQRSFRKKSTKNQRKRRGKRRIVLSLRVFGLLSSLFFFLLFSEKRTKKLSPTFFFKGGGGFRANYMRNFFTFARALYRATLYQRERGKDEQHQRILRGKRGK